MCRPDDFPPYDPALGAHEPAHDTSGPLPPFISSPEQRAKDAADWDAYIDDWTSDQLTDPKAFIDGVPYTPAEAKVVRALIRAAAEDDPGEAGEP